jgi:acetyltransferase-like isoleucine patch superfamily enzyme
MDAILNVLSVTKGEKLPTCSIRRMEADHVTFASKYPILWEVNRRAESVYVILSTLIPIKARLPEWVVPIWSNNPTWDFTVYHNHYWKDHVSQDPEVHDSTFVESSAVLGPVGIKIVQNELGERLQMKHIGKVFVGRKGYVGPGAVIHRALFGATIVEDEVVIGAMCNIGHGAFVGYKTILAPGVLIGGSAKIGRQCFLGQGCNIRDHVSICDRVKVGMGAVVTKDIKEPGIYYGSPAILQGDWDGGW